MSQSASIEHGPIVLAISGDPSGTWAGLARTWNQAHPTEPVTLRVLSADATLRHDALATAGRAKSGEFTVMALDSTWVLEFASNGWLTELPSADLPTTGLLASAVSAGTYQGKQYGFPVAADATVLYYRSDLLAAAKVSPPKTWAELRAACAKVQAQQRLMVSCYGTGLQASESLTANVTEAVDSAGGEFVTAEGKPGLDSTQAATGIGDLAAAVADATVPKAALGWDDQEAASAFTDGDLVFLRGWSSTWHAAQAIGGSSKVAGRVGVAALVVPSGVGVPTLGGSQLAISANARNKATAQDLIRWLTSEEIQRQALTSGALAPVRESLYSEAALVKRQPYLATVAAAIKAARARPVMLRYPELSTAVQEAIFPVLQGKAEVAKVLPDLQTKLTDLLK
jgi:multiple sugar transport system substrate-binding protein